MAVAFSGVTSIQIPEGDVAKITETSSGRVLWEKEKAYSALRYFIYIKNGNKASGFTSYQYGGYTTHGTINKKLTITNSLAIGSIIVLPSYGVSAFKEVNTGDEFIACYVTKESEEENIQKTALKATDAAWKLSYFYICAMSQSQLSMQGYYITPSLTANYGLVRNETAPLTISPSSGSTTRVSSILSDLSRYKTAYENCKSYTGYRDKSTYPYLYGSLQLSYSSASLKKLNGESTGSTAGDSTITLFFTILR